ncbi:MAG TPA: hypothetical protein VG890_11815 [Puia sp.]|nr:hypothetical protein [Puia sp.]
MKNSKWILILSAVLMVAMISCQKGDTGPAGPQGPAGPDSVVYSQWILLSPTFDDNDTLFLDTVNAPSITQGILDSGIVLSYVNIGSSSAPDIVATSSINYVVLFEEFTVGKIYLTISPYDDLSDMPYRYVTIPGSKIEGNRTTGSVNGYTIQELKKLPYEQAQKIVSN